MSKRKRKMSGSKMNIFWNICWNSCLAQKQDHGLLEMKVWSQDSSSWRQVFLRESNPIAVQQ